MMSFSRHRSLSSETSDSRPSSFRLRKLCLGTVLLCSAALGGTILGGYAPSVQAAPENSVAPLPPHLHHPRSFGTMLAFSTTGEAKAVPTILTLHLSARSNSTSPAEAQQKLNQMMDQAVKLSSDASGIENHAENYNVSEDYNANAHGGPKHWTAQQNLSLRGKDTAKLFTLTEQLQRQGLMLDSMDWSLEPEIRENLEKQARAEALKKLRPLAEADARLLDMHIVRIKHVTIGNMPSEEPFGPRPMLMAARMEAAPMPPQGTAQEQIVRVRVNASFILAPNNSANQADMPAGNEPD